MPTMLKPIDTTPLPADDLAMFRKWRRYEWARIKRAAIETKWTKWLGGGFFMGLVADGARYEFGLRTEHDTIYYIGIAIGCAAVGALIAFFSRLLVLPATISAEQENVLQQAITAREEKIAILVAENTSLKNQIEDNAPKVKILASMKDEMGSRHGSYADLNIRVTNLGKNVIRVENVFLINHFPPQNEVLQEIDDAPIDIRRLGRAKLKNKKLGSIFYKTPREILEFQNHFPSNQHATSRWFEIAKVILDIRLAEDAANSAGKIIPGLSSVVYINDS